MIGSHIDECCYTAYERKKEVCEGCPAEMAFKDGRIHTVVRSAPTDKGLMYFENTASVLRDAEGKIIAGLEVARDITARKHAEEILSESEEKYRLLFHNSPIGIFNYDGGLQITDCNENFADLVKTGRQELIGLDMEKLKDTRVLPALREALEGREGFYEGPYWANTIPAGIWISMHTAPLFNQDNEVKGGVGIVEDITERKETENERADYVRQTVLGAEVGVALTQNADLRRALQFCAESLVKNLEAAFARIWILNEKENVLELQASAGMYTHINGPHGRVPVGKFKIGLIAQEKKPHLTNAVIGDPRIGDPEWAKREGMVAFAGYPLIVADKLVGVMAMFSRKLLHDTALTAMSSIADEIALGIERNRSEVALKESESRYRTLAEAAQDVIFVINREGRVEYVNSFGAGLFGLQPSELIGSSRETLFPDATESQRIELRDVFKTGRPLYAEYKTRLRSGELWLGTLLVPMRDQAGETISVMGISRDINGRKRAEEQVRQQLQQLSALRSIDMAISSSLDIRLTLDIFLEQVMSQLHVDAACVLLLKPYTKLLEFAAHRGFRTQALKHTRIRLGEGNAGIAALKRSIVHIPDVKSDGAFSRVPHLNDEQFVSYYGIPLIAKGEVKGVLEIFHRSPLHPDQGWQDFLESLALQAAIAIDNVALFENLERSNLELVMAYDSTIEGWSRALDYRDKETEGHSQRVTDLAVKISQAMGMTDRELTHVRWGALLHDIGKLGVPDNILFKPGKLNDDEWKIMKRHPVLAYELLGPIRYLGAAVDIPYCHHEKWDGTGYPRGLKGEQIPLAARIFSIVDVWDALGSDRPYRPAWPNEKIFQYLNDQSGKDFDPKVTEMFVKLLGEGVMGMHLSGGEKL